MIKLLPEVTEEIKGEAARKLQVTIMPRGFLVWHGVNAWHKTEEQKQDLFNEECNRIYEQSKARSNQSPDSTDNK